MFTVSVYRTEIINIMAGSTIILENLVAKNTLF